jgi:hypothetical protein
MCLPLRAERGCEEDRRLRALAEGMGTAAA